MPTAEFGQGVPQRRRLRYVEGARSTASHPASHSGSWRTPARQGDHPGEVCVGAVQVFADAGCQEVSSPSVRRTVTRIEF
jgi:hypothetical protein